MASGNDIRMAVDKCVSLLAGAANAIQRIPEALATVSRPGNFAPHEVELIIEMASRRLARDVVDAALVPVVDRVVSQ
jgi:hypothetical protein